MKTIKVDARTGLKEITEETIVDDTPAIEQEPSDIEQRLTLMQAAIDDLILGGGF
jgi:hypothetical protein